MSDISRQVRLRIDGEAVRQKAVPLTVLADKLNALQRAVYAVANSVLGKTGRGRLSKAVKSSCNLTFVELTEGSIELVAELPPQLTFDGPEFDLAKDVRLKMVDVIGAAQSRNIEVVRGIFPDTSSRVRVLSTLARLVPNESDDITVQIGLNGPGTWIGLDEQLGTFFHIAAIEEQIGQDIADIQVQTLIGKLFRIEVESSRQHIGLRVDGREIECRYPDHLADHVSQFVAGSLVQVEGIVSLDSAGNIKAVDTILDVNELDMSPFVISRVSANNIELHLGRAILVDVSYQSGLWIHEYAPLGILSYADTRKESMARFRDEFVFLWCEYAQCKDEDLTLDAQQLKQKLQSMVKHSEQL